MRQKELRLALVCYGGVSLAVYMHGVTKEIWHLAQASRAHHSGEGAPHAVGYVRLLRDLEQRHGLRLRILPDILTGASAGGINAVFLAQAIHSGQSLDPLTDLWLSHADTDSLVAREAVPAWRFAKSWAQPLVWWLLRRPGNVVSESVSPETRAEVRDKVSRLIRGRWFQPPFSGLRFARLLRDALGAMRAGPQGQPLLPPGHPLDLFVTATDFHGYLALLPLNSPPLAEESEHRMPIGFRSPVPAASGEDLADPAELVFAARSTASFPGAFPPLQLAEIDALLAETGTDWPTRTAFLARVMPAHVRQGRTEQVSLIDGSVLVNAPFAEATRALEGRPAQREVDRRFIYIDPRPNRHAARQRNGDGAVSFFGAIFGSLSTIPREQPIRDNLDQLAAQSREADRLRQVIGALRPEVEASVERLFGRTLFLDRPTARRLAGWREKAQQAAAEQAGYAFVPYAQAKMAGIVDRLARIIADHAPAADAPPLTTIALRLREELAQRGLARLSTPAGGATPGAIAFFRAHDIGFRIRRLRLIARRLSRDWELDESISAADLDRAREAIYEILALYFPLERGRDLGPGMTAAAGNVLIAPGTAIDTLAASRLLPETDLAAEAMLEAALAAMPRPLRRRVLLTYLGFPFYDVATLPLLREDGYNEFDPIKVDRISPEDALSIRGGTEETLRGIEFYNFGAFFSRSYRENDYLWGRLHGAERVVDLVYSTLDQPAPEAEIRAAKKALFLAILDEEEQRLTADPRLIPGLRAEIAAKLA